MGLIQGQYKMTPKLQKHRAATSSGTCRANRKRT